MALGEDHPASASLAAGGKVGLSRVKATARKVLVGILGGLVLALGLAMIVLPGPAFIIIPAGLAILASEFEWAKRLKVRCEQKFKQWRDDHRRQKAAKRGNAAKAY